MILQAIVNYFFKDQVWYDDNMETFGRKMKEILRKSKLLLIEFTNVLLDNDFMTSILERCGFKV